MIDDTYTIIVDTREQRPWSFAHRATSKTKLDTGDYSIAGMEDIIAIERKQSVNEIATNIVETRFVNVLKRLSSIKYGFILLEFDLEDIFRYPIGSNMPKHLWEKSRIKPQFIMKHVLEWQMKYNIHVLFCGDADNAEKTAEYIFDRVYKLENINE